MNWTICGLSFLCLLLLNSSVVNGIYDSNHDQEVKSRPIVREPLRRINPTEYHGQVQIHDQYSRVATARSSPQHFGRSDSHVMKLTKSPGQTRVTEPTLTQTRVRENLQRPGENNRQGRQQESINELDNDIIEYGTECPAQGTGRFPYLMDCRQFLNCWKGRGYIQSCAPGTMFNSETSECDLPSKVKCATMNDPTLSENYQSGDSYQQPTNRWTPVGNLNSQQQQSRPPQLSSRGQFSDDEIKCPRGASGLFEHPFYCNKFLNCANGAVHIQDCGPGTAFNPLFKVCDWPHNVNCGQKVMFVEGQTDNPQSGNFREPKYNDGEGQLDVRWVEDSTPRRQYPIYTRPSTTPNPLAIELPSQSLQPPLRPTQPASPQYYNQNRKYPQNHQTPVVNRQLPWERPSSTPINRFPSTTPISTGYKPNYNRQYYNQNQNGQTPEENDLQDLPLSQALQLLLQPYMGKNKNLTTNMENVTSILAAQMNPSTAQNTEIGFQMVSTEQENMNGGVFPTENNNNDSGETPLPHPLPSTTPLPSLPPGHSADWHRRHPNVPVGGNHNHHHRHHPHNHHHSQSSDHFPSGHSADWHRRHPNVPMGGNSHHHNHHHHNQNQQPNTNTKSLPNFNPAVVPLGGRTPVPRNECAGKFDCNNTKCIDFDAVCDGRNDCENRHDEINCDHIGYEVRLSNELGTKHEGRIEVKVYDQWGYVCDDKFGMRDAQVICKELGFPLGAAEVRANSHYPANVNMKRGGNVIFMMDEIDCKGNENSLKECEFSGWGVHDCNDEEVVGVVCKIPVMACPLDYWLCDTSQECIPTGFLCDNVPDCTDHSDENESHCKAPIQVRLVNGKSPLEGRVEINYRGIWGTVCDDDFNNKEANVVCRSLGYHGPASVIKNKYGSGTGTIWLDQVNCFGNETGIEDCTHWHWGEHNCEHNEDVGVKCTEGIPPPTTPEVNLRSNTEQIANVNFFDDQEPFEGRYFEKHALLEPDTCGRIQVPTERNQNQRMGFKVINATTAKHGHHPWQAALRVRGNGKTSHWCGAVLISRYHLLTAAHCLVGYPKGAYFVRLGDHNSEIKENSEVEVFIENIYIHESFRKGQHMNNDIALLVLKSPGVRYTNYIQPICLPEKNSIYFAGMNCTISGWGSIQSGKSTPSLDLRSGTIPIIHDDVCREDHIYGNVISEGMFCAGKLDEGVDACMGDSGGGLVCENDGVHRLYGIISWGFHCGYANKPGVYVKVSHYLDWIQEKLNHSMTNYGV